MGFHQPHLKCIGAWMEPELTRYVDGLKDQRGLGNRSDAIRAIIREHAHNSSQE